MLKILLSNPAVWEKTALIVMYDEHGGFFDHVIPPTPPAGTPGEYLTVPDINARFTAPFRAIRGSKNGGDGASERWIAGGNAASGMSARQAT